MKKSYAMKDKMLGNKSININIMISKVIKATMTFVEAKSNGVQLSGGGNYIGLNTKIVNRGTMKLKGQVSVRPSCALFCHEATSLLEIGKGSDIGNHSRISSVNKIIIEDEVLIGPHVLISDNNHKYSDPLIPIIKQGVSCKKDYKVIIGEGSWVGTNAVIVGNVRIGKHCVIGANAVVTKDIPDYCVAVGIPAKVIRKYNFKTDQWERV